MGGNNGSSIMECITKNETNVREARFVLLCSSSLTLYKCAVQMYGIAVLISQTLVSECEVFCGSRVILCNCVKGGRKL